MNKPLIKETHGGMCRLQSQADMSQIFCPRTKTSSFLKHTFQMLIFFILSMPLIYGLLHMVLDHDIVIG
jgi:predicted ABC-type exoprotein transport system permease subunit